MAEVARATTWEAVGARGAAAAASATTKPGSLALILKRKRLRSRAGEASFVTEEEEKGNRRLPIHDDELSSLAKARVWEGLVGTVNGRLP